MIVAMDAVYVLVGIATFAALIALMWGIERI